MPRSILLLIAGTALLLAACTSDDYGRCLASHEESRPTDPIVLDNGLLAPSGEYETVTICDRWEYPGGLRP